MRRKGWMWWASIGTTIPCEGAALIGLVYGFEGWENIAAGGDLVVVGGTPFSELLGAIGIGAAAY